jgi:hypothetical protein
MKKVLFISLILFTVNAFEQMENEKTESKNDSIKVFYPV